MLISISLCKKIRYIKISSNSFLFRCIIFHQSKFHNLDQWTNRNTLTSVLLHSVKIKHHHQMLILVSLCKRFRYVKISSKALLFWRISFPPGAFNCIQFSPTLPFKYIPNFNLFLIRIFNNVPQKRLFYSSSLL